MSQFKGSQWAAIGISFALVAAVGAGVASLGEREIPETAQTPEPVEEVSPVDVNQNAPAKQEEESDLDHQDQTTASSAEETAQVPAEETAQAPAETSQTAQAETSGMTEEALTFIWPMEGEIGLDYAETATVYDPTLEQYRTNDTVAILAQEGTPVTAAADGVVQSVTTDEEKGKTVVIAHPEGWVTTYSQSAEAVAVSEGDHVVQGQEIGQVGAPTKYGVALGSHLDFQIAQGDRAMDPKRVIG